MVKNNRTHEQGITHKRRGSILWEILMVSKGTTGIPQSSKVGGQGSAKFLIPSRNPGITKSKYGHTVSPCKYWSRPLPDKLVITSVPTGRNFDYNVQVELPVSILDSWSRYCCIVLYGILIQEEITSDWGKKFFSALALSDISRISNIWDAGPYSEELKFSTFEGALTEGLDILWLKLKSSDCRDLLKNSREVDNSKLSYTEKKRLMELDLDHMWLSKLLSLVQAYHKTAVNTRNRTEVQYDIGG